MASRLLGRPLSIAFLLPALIAPSAIACSPSSPPVAASAPAGPAPDSAQAERDINAALDDWHDAAARADEERYFGHLTKDAVFLGTDATERWDTSAFRAFAHPFFARGKAWSFRPTRRVVTVAPGALYAWFDEDLDTPNMGPARGSGVLVRGAPGERWRIAQYNLALTIPNERLDEVKKLLSTPAPAPPAKP
jgi:ketosteroid isomerase-like protein